MAFDDNNPDEVFDDEPEPDVIVENDEQSNRSFRMMMIGLAAIGGLGVLLIALIFISRQNQNSQFLAEQEKIQQTNAAVAALSLITPTPLSTATQAPTNTAVAPALKDLVDTALSTPNFKTLASLLQAAGLTDELKGSGPFTLFAPTDDAFAQIAPESLEALKKDPTKLAALLKYHVIAGAVKASDLSAMTGTKTLEGDPLAITTKDGKSQVNGAALTGQDLDSANGVIHAIDRVLIPAAVRGDVAVLVPAQPGATLKDLVDTALSTPNFKTLASLLQAAGLTDELKGSGPFTLFAPTDDAFAQIAPESLEALKKDPTKLAALLKYHVISGAVKASDLSAMTGTKTLEGDPLAITTKDGKSQVNGAALTGQDLDSANGVIHAIDRVLIPAAVRGDVAVLAPAAAQPGAALKDLVDTALSTPNFRTLASLLQTAGLTDELKGSGPFTLFAPTDDAFAQIAPESLEALKKDPTKLAALLKYHVISGAVKASDLSAMTGTKTLEGGPLVLAVKDNKQQVNGAALTGQDLDSANGVIHAIDRVLIPAALRNNVAVLVSATAQPGKGTAVAQVQGTATAKAPAAGTAAVPTRVPPQAATATAAAAKGITGTQTITGTAGTGNQGLPSTGAGDNLVMWLVAAAGLVGVLVVARRMRTTQN